ncbi:hypothetical protein L484_007406 [Morus notabilis]|uniref:Uncharacterized protein n=1 Tax=Morus notabilis TaxID=981085 RepID=W9QCM9_9ROSA|nr:hypothetical protein L484_007406 [Morus notabilis]
MTLFLTVSTPEFTLYPSTMATRNVSGDDYTLRLDYGRMSPKAFDTVDVLRVWTKDIMPLATFPRNRRLFLISRPRDRRQLEV